MEFVGGVWQNKIDVNNFILNNYTQYNGDSSFLCKPTARTKKLYKKVNDLLIEEQKRGGVYDIDTVNVATILSHKPGYIDKKNEIVVGLQTDGPLKRAINPFGGLRTCKQACEAYGYKLDPSVLEYFKFKTTHNDGVFRMYSKEMRAARHTGILTGLPDSYGRGRIIGDYRRVALYGIDKLIEEKEIDKDLWDNKSYSDEVARVLDELSKQVIYLKDLKEMAMQYGVDISKPAQNATQAIQWTYFGYLGSIKEQNGAANSFGRISNFFDIYIERDINNGTLTEEKAQELIDDFVIKLRLVRHLRTPDYDAVFAGDPTWVTLSEAGVTKSGKHMVTKTSYRILQTLYNLGPCSEPNITILWSSKLPQNYKDFCAQVSIDTDSIQYESDDLMRKDFGDDYSIACCVSAMKTGKQMQLFGARCNLPKVLLMSLNGGKDEIYGEQLAPEGNVFKEEVLNYNQVIKSYKFYSAWLAKLYVNTLNAIHFSHDRYAYERLTMALHDTEVERLMAFGVCGLSVIVDSLSAIKYAKVTPIKDDRGIIVDFKTEGDFPKYGNDDNRVDSIAKFVLKHFITELKKTKTYRDAKHTLSVLTITSNVMYGKKTGNTPDGRKKGEPFAPGANPMHGRDCCGALASLNSVSKLNYNDCKDGVSNTFSVVPEVLGSDKANRINRLTAIIDGYFKKGAHHLNVNVLNREMLIDAMENPEKYPNLTIRVSGYAVMFNRLTKEQQLEVISRTFHNKI